MWGEMREGWWWVWGVWREGERGKRVMVKLVVEKEWLGLLFVRVGVEGCRIEGRRGCS